MAGLHAKCHDRQLFNSRTSTMATYIEAMTLSSCLPPNGCMLQVADIAFSQVTQ